MVITGGAFKSCAALHYQVFKMIHFMASISPTHHAVDFP